jgi:hypothetical protein
VVRWVRAGLVEAGLPDQGFDLVSAQHRALLHTPTMLRTYAAVGRRTRRSSARRASRDRREARQAHGFDAADYVSPADVALLLDEDSALEIDEERPRHVATGAGAHHTRDVVLRVRRLR